MKNIIVFILVIIGSSCSTIPQSPFDLLGSQSVSMSLSDMERRYPYWNMKMMGFYVADEDPGFYDPNNLPIITSEQKKESRRLSIRSKEKMLEKLAMLRFVLNTPEFADAVKTRQFYSSRDASGPYGSVKWGDPLNSERLVYVLQKVSFYTTIKKRATSFGAAASANVGEFLYVASDEVLNSVPFKGLFVNFPNKENWENYQNTSYYLGVLFHELVHNMGFNHTLDGTGLADATYGLQGVLVDTFSDPKWQKKYKKQLDLFQYYTKKYDHLLQKDSIVGQIRQFDNDNVITTGQQFDDTATNNDRIEEVCILKEDGTYEIVKMKNGRII